jgi:hypothetical protein
LVRASACHAEGRGFESRRSRHSIQSAGPIMLSGIVRSRAVAFRRPRIYAWKSGGKSEARLTKVQSWCL